MSSLLDQVLRNKENPSADALLAPKDDRAHTLSDGAVIYDSTVSAINRILEKNPHLHKRPTGVPSAPYALYNGHTPVSLTDRQTFLRLLKADWLPATPYQAAFLADKVLELAPTLSRDCLMVSDYLIWDREEGELRKIEDEGSIRSVS